MAVHFYRRSVMKLRGVQFSAAAAILIVGLAATGRVNAEVVTLRNSSVTGGLYVENVGTNRFDPLTGLVPSGYANVASTTVLISSSAVEFGSANLFTRDTADFTGTQLTLERVVTAAGWNAPITQYFSDAAFAGLTCTKTSDSYLGGVNYSLSGEQLRIDWAGGVTPANIDFKAVFTFSPVPEPPTWTLLSVGAVAAGLVTLRRRHNAA